MQTIFFLKTIILKIYKANNELCNYAIDNDMAEVRKFLMLFCKVDETCLDYENQFMREIQFMSSFKYDLVGFDSYKTITNTQTQVTFTNLETLFVNCTRLVECRAEKSGEQKKQK